MNLGQMIDVLKRDVLHRRIGPSMAFDVLCQEVERLEESTLSTVLLDVARERSRQDKKWGEQNHDMADYYTILGEEFGEVGKAICESKLQKIVAPQEIRKELIQLAAVAVAMAEAFDHNRSDWQEFK